MAKAKKFGTGRAKRYDEGGDIEVPEEGTGLKKESFGDAFKRNRARGEKTFEFNGKKYTTEVKGEAASKPKSSVTTMRPTDEDVSRVKTIQSAYASRGPEWQAKREKEQALEGSHPEALLLGGPLAKGAARLLGGKAAKEVKDRIEPTMDRDPVLRDITPKQIGNTPKQLGGPSRQLPAPAPRPSPAKQLSGPKKVEEKPSRAPRDDDESRFADEGNPNFKRGGKVKKMASGGKTRSASSRADGCAIRGKTRA